MVFAVGVVIGICGAFFTPAVSSVIPDITGKSKVVQANSVFSMLQARGNIAGNSAGSVLFQALGAPLLFLFNGLSYLFSAEASSSPGSPGSCTPRKSCISPPI
jgi:DHA3 family macrolide efflux protein-like MFS transporter